MNKDHILYMHNYVEYYLFLIRMVLFKIRIRIFNNKNIIETITILSILRHIAQIVPKVTVLVNLEDFMLSEINQSQKDKCMILLI